MLNIINGKEVASSDKKIMKIINPYTGRLVDTVPSSTEKDAQKAISYAQKAQKSWAKVPVHVKGDILRKKQN